MKNKTLTIARKKKKLDHMIQKHARIATVFKRQKMFSKLVVR